MCERLESGSAPPQIRTGHRASAFRDDSRQRGARETRDPGSKCEPGSAQATSPGYGRSRKRRNRPTIANTAITPIATALRIQNAIGTQRTSSCDAAKIQLSWRAEYDRLVRPAYHQKPTATIARATTIHQFSA